MGFFDNLKKKKEAKALGLSVDQYDQFLIAKTEGITLNSFKRYISSFTGKYSLNQYAQYLELEDKGYSVAQCERYFSELSGKVAVADYADFLAAEQLGLTVSEYATYAASLKGAMSAVDYVGFLKAQKLGLTMGKYLRYIKSFKGEMTVEEYDIYLKAEENADFDPRRKAISKNGGREIICQCEGISKEEILEAIRRGAKTVDGVKRRVGSGMGRCQGSRCSNAIEKILEQCQNERL